MAYLPLLKSVRYPLIILFLILGFQSSFAGQERNELFAISFGFPDWEASDKVSFLHEAGFDGIAGWVMNETLLAEFKETLETELVQSGAFKVYGVYFPYRFSNEEHRALVSKTIEACEPLGVPLWIAIGASAENDETTVSLLKSICEEAEGKRIDVILYPHDRNYLLDVEDTIRIIEKVGASNLFTSIQLHHELRAKNSERLEEIVRYAAPYSKLAVISGTCLPEDVNTGSRDWSDVVKPLSESLYDVEGFFKMLQNSEFKGPVGLMNWKIPGDPKIHHVESLAILKSWQ